MKITKADKIHYVLYKHFDLHDVPMPYERATEVVAELRKSKLIY